MSGLRFVRGPRRSASRSPSSTRGRPEGDPLAELKIEAPARRGATGPRLSVPSRLRWLNSGAKIKPPQTGKTQAALIVVSCCSRSRRSPSRPSLIVLLPGPDTLVTVRSIVRGRPIGRAGHRKRHPRRPDDLDLGRRPRPGRCPPGQRGGLRRAADRRARLYLAWLGFQSLRAARRLGAGRGCGPTSRAGRADCLGTGFTAGLVTNLLNPKVGVFFITFLPGFVPSGYPVGLTSLLFGAVFIVLSLAYYVALAGARRQGDDLDGPRPGSVAASMRSPAPSSWGSACGSPLES